MIQDLDRTIAALLATRAASGSELAQAVVDFDVPDADWRSRLHTPLTVSCYLHSLAENTAMRSTEPLVRRSADGRIATVVVPPLRLDCGYLITAWSRAEQQPALIEHRLLSQVLTVLARYPTLPNDVLVGSLATGAPPYPTAIATPDSAVNRAEYWTALGQHPRPAVGYVVTLALFAAGEPTPVETVRDVDVREIDPAPSLPLLPVSGG
jgi:hypothetical protein